MKKWLLKRILFSLFSLMVVTLIVMWMTYTLMDRSIIFVNDPTINKLSGTTRELYKHNKYVEYGYEEFTNYSTYVNNKYRDKYGEGYEEHEDFIAAMEVVQDSARYETYPDVVEFTSLYKGKGYKMVYLSGTKRSEKNYLLAVLEKNAFQRFGNFLANFFSIETINDVKDYDTLPKSERYIRWEWDQRSNMPALVGNGTIHRYLIYFDNQFPFVHQNIVHINLGKSNVTFKGIDVSNVLNMNTGSTEFSEQEFPVDIGTGVTHETSYNFHTVTFSSTISEYSESIYGKGNHYIGAEQFTSGLTRIGNSFIIGICSTIICYLIGLPIGIWMARRKDKLVDKIGNAYIVFIMAVPSLAYIFIIAAIGTSMGLPLKWSSDNPFFVAALLPIISLSLPAIGGLMRWMRRFMIDQSNADYVKFARSAGMTEREIFSRHIAPNAFIFLVRGIPGDILFALVGALITERVYAIPGIGGLVTNAITAHDNGIVVAGTVFYTFLSILSLILGDLLLAKYDPRVSFTNEKG